MARTFSEHLTEWINAADAERLNEANKAAKSTHESTAPAKVIKFPRKRPNLTLVTQANVSKSEKPPESD